MSTFEWDQSRISQVTGNEDINFPLAISSRRVAGCMAAVSISLLESFEFVDGVRKVIGL
jgi:hypothetical protein